MARRTLSNEVKQGILDGLKSGMKPVELAATFQVSVPTIYNYRKLNVVAAEAPATVMTEAAATTGTAVLSGTRKASKTR